MKEENLLWKRLWTCRITDQKMNEKFIFQLSLVTTLCNLTNANKHFRKTWLHFLPSLKMEMGGFSEMLITTYWIARCHNQTQHNLTAFNF